MAGNWYAWQAGRGDSHSRMFDDITKDASNDSMAAKGYMVSLDRWVSKERPMEEPALKEISRV